MGLSFSSEKSPPSPKSSVPLGSSPLSECVVPTKQYFDITSTPSTKLAQPSPKLIILDLNGTLVYRRKTRSITSRPFIEKFIDYLFSADNNFLVMVWTTSRPENADIMVNFIFGDQKEKLIAVWGR